MAWLCHSVTLSLCDSVTLWLCDSVVNKRSNNSAAFHPFGPKFFLRPFGQKSMSQKFFFSRPRAGWAGAGGQKNSDLSSYLSHLTRYRSEIWNLGSKLQNKIKIFYKKISADGRGPTAETDYAHFGPYQRFALKWPKFILHFKFKLIKKNLIGQYLAGRQPCVWPKRPAT